MVFATNRPGSGPQCRPPMGLVSRDQGARRKSMLEYRRRRATKRSAVIPIGPKGYGAASRLVSHHHQRVSDGLALRRALGHLALLSAGCRRHGPVFFVASPRRWRDIAVVAAPRIRTHGARNGRRWGPRPGLEGAERVLAVRRAPRGEKTPLGAIYRRPQQTAGEICGLF